MAKNYAVMRWLNDNNKVSVHNLKYVVTPKENYNPGDVGQASYPGYPGVWEFRIIRVGGKKELDTWLESNFNSLMVDVNDTSFIASSQHEEPLMSPCCEKEIVDTPKQKEENDEPLMSPCCEKEIVDKPKQKEENDAALQRKAQKDFAESLLSKRTLESKMQKDFTDTHRDCVSVKEFLVLKDDFRRLKRKVVSLESELMASNADKRCSGFKKSQSGESSLVEVTEKSRLLPLPQMDIPCESTKSMESPINSPPKVLQTSPISETFYNNHSKSSLQDAISHMDDLYPAVKTLLLMLFPHDYIKTHSISGKASNSKLVAKPPFDSRLFSVMVAIIKDKFGCKNKEINEKVHSVQKWILKQKK